MEHFFQTRKVKILVSSFLMAVFLVVGGFAIQGHSRAAAYRNALNNGYQHAFTELTTAVYEMDSALQKLSFATSPTLISSLCTELFGKAMSAQMALGELPYGNVELEQTAAFIAKAGDYAAALSKNAAVNGACSAEERRGIQDLAAVSSSLSQTLQDLQADIHRGTISIEDLSQAEAQLSVMEGNSRTTAGSSFQSVEADFPETPSLVYDGPFSEHLSGRAPKFLEGMPEVNQAAAQAAAAAFLDVKPEVFTLISSGEGDLPTWGFSGVIEGGEVYVEVTRRGGVVVEVLNSRPVGEASISADHAVETALAFLKEKGFHNLSPSYFINQGGVLTINLAAVQDNVVCYPDLMKISVALDTGRIIGYEALGYLMNHTDRTLAAPAVSEKDAQAVTSAEVDILSHQLALIPTGGEYEVLCHEFKCRTSDGRHILIYVNASTGNEEKILLLLEDESGTLAI